MHHHPQPSETFGIGYRTQRALNYIHSIIPILIAENFRVGGYRASDIAIITPYMAHFLRYRKALFPLMQQGAFLYSKLPKVATTTSMQGKESRVVIYDWVISSASSFSEMGFTTGDDHGNVGMSRVHVVMLSLIPSSVGKDETSNLLPCAFV